MLDILLNDSQSITEIKINEYCHAELVEALYRIIQAVQLSGRDASTSSV
jgi:hypothetical protein